MSAPRLLMMPSVLDRLIDYDRDDPDFDADAESEGTGTLSTTPYATDFLLRHLERDLENLLQTSRGSLKPLGPEYEELSTSIYQYGLPDRVSFRSTSTDQERLADEVRRAIANFEPRLQHVQVLLQEESLDGGQIKFLIRGQVRLRPAPRTVHFDAKLSTTLRAFKVNERTAAVDATAIASTTHEQGSAE